MGLLGKIPARRQCLLATAAVDDDHTRGDVLDIRHVVPILCIDWVLVLLTCLSRDQRQQELPAVLSRLFLREPQRQRREALPAWVDLHPRGDGGVEGLVEAAELRLASLDGVSLLDLAADFLGAEVARNLAAH